MKNIGSFGAVMAALTALRRPNYLYSGFDQFERKPSAKPRMPPPNDEGPVIDTTKESKRARRRRLAREGKTDA